MTKEKKEQNNLYNKDLEIKEFDVNYSGEGMLVKIFDLNRGLIEYEHMKIIRIISKDYNLLIMQDYLPIIGEIDGSIEIKNEEINLSYKKINAFYMSSNNVFNLMIKEIIEE